MKWNNGNALTILIFIVVGIIAIVFIRKKLKPMRLPNVVIITGAPKTGKSALSLYLARVRYLKNVFAWHVCKPLYWFKKHSLNDYPLRPMFYVNAPVKYNHNMITGDILTLQVKVPPRSVFWFDEVSLLADSMLFKNDELNYQLLIFWKTIGHTTYGGSVFMNTQCISDVHHAIKRVLGSYLYIHDTRKFPFFSLCRVREMVYSDDNSVGNNVTEDLDLSMRTFLMFNWVYKKYDCYNLSTLVDKKPTRVDYDYQFDKKNLKVYYIVSFNKRTESVNQGLHKDFFDAEGNLLSEEDRYNLEVVK